VDTGPLALSGRVDAYFEASGQRRPVKAEFRRSGDGSVDVDIVVVDFSQDEKAALQNAEVEVAWLCDETAKDHRLMVLFRQGAG
jgi:hypothetical protein